MPSRRRWTAIRERGRSRPAGPWAPG
jgi:hypothetical protein